MIQNTHKALYKIVVVHFGSLLVRKRKPLDPASDLISMDRKHSAVCKQGATQDFFQGGSKAWNSKHFKRVFVHCLALIGFWLTVSSGKMSFYGCCAVLCLETLLFDRCNIVSLLGYKHKNTWERKLIVRKCTTSKCFLKIGFVHYVCKFFI